LLCFWKVRKAIDRFDGTMYAVDFTAAAASVLAQEGVCDMCRYVGCRIKEDWCDEQRGKYLPTGKTCGIGTLPQHAPSLVFLFIFFSKKKKKARGHAYHLFLASFVPDMEIFR